MEESKKAEVKTKEKKKVSMKIVIVLAAIIIFGLITTITTRAEYLNYMGIGEKYISVLEQKIHNKYIVFGTAFVTIYVFSYVLNRFIKRGLKKFFEDEKKEMPKLPNKSLSLLLALFGATVASIMLTDKLAIFRNAAQFGQYDPIFGADIGYYMFSLPFIQTLLIFLMEVFVVAIIYTALYYVITLNSYFDGVDVETLKKNTFVKQEIFILVLLAIVFCTYIFIGSQNILTGEMLTIGDEAETELIGAGKTDVTIKLWGYRILTFVVAIAVIRLLVYIKKQSFKQSVISVLIVPTYLLGMFLVMIYFQTIHVGDNELDNEKEYIGYNIRNTKAAYNIDIDQQNINNYSEITADQLEKNKNVISNIPLITEDVTLTAVLEHQDDKNSSYYTYENTFLSMYKVNGEDKLMYITPREILNDSTISNDSRTFKYTHGYSVIASSTIDEDSNGYAEYLLSDFSSENVLNIKEPRIYFGLQTNNTIITNSDFGKEYDYPTTPSKNQENSYAGEAGLKLDFLDRLVLAVSERNYQYLSPDFTEETKVINYRNVIERAKKILPDVLYEEEPYLVITDEGRLVWVVDGYTRSNAYPYSQSTVINIKGYKEELNYIRNSVKVLIDAYDGTTEFYITDTSDPIIMTYRNIYPDLFKEELPQDIQEHLVYPKFLYNIQADIINTYHDISEDTLYRANDVWQITPKASATKSTVVGVEMEPYYTVLKTKDSSTADLGLFVTYNKYEKQNITSYLVGTVKNGKSKLSLYKIDSENNVAGIIQLNNQIEQDTTITKQLEDINTSGTRLLKDMIIIPIDNTLLYVEPIYQVMLNDDSQIPVLKKVIVASGNSVAIGDNLNQALTNLFSDDYSVDLEFINVEDIDALVDSVIKANNNLTESLQANNFEMIGKDISSLQEIINKLETARKNELEKEKLLNNENKVEETRVEDNENVVSNEISNTVENTVQTNTSNLVTNNTTR